jgi:HEAT repeat protein
VLEDPHVSLSWNATASLGRIGTPEAVSILIEQLRIKEEGSLEKYYAQEALLKVTNRTAFPTLVRALSDPTPLVVHTAQEVLTRLGGEEAVQPLAQTLQHADPGIRRRAVEALKTIGHPQAVPFLKDALGQEYEGIVKVRIAEALASFGEESGRVALIPLIRHWDEGVRVAAIRAVGDYAVKEAVPALAALLKSPLPNWRALSAEALGKIGDTAVTNEIEEISQKDPSPEVREIAAKALNRLKVRQEK